MYLNVIFETNGFNEVYLKKLCRHLGLGINVLKVRNDRIIADFSLM